MSDPSVQGPADAVLAHRIRFVSDVPPGSRVLREFVDPDRRFAVCETLSLEELPKPGDVGVEPDVLYFLFVPGGSASAFEVQKRAERWMARPEADDAVPTIELLMRSDRVLWRPGRAMMQGGAERLTETLAALADFAYHEGELRKLETEINAGWKTAEADIPLTHSVDRASLLRQPHVDAMTRRVTMARMRYARLEAHLEKASPTLPGPARRLVSELIAQSEIGDRLSSLDDRLEVFEDLYELATDRLCEFSYFRRECRLEIWIILILGLELALMGMELWVAWQE